MLKKFFNAVEQQKKIKAITKQNVLLTQTVTACMEDIQSYHINDRDGKVPYNTKKAMVTELLSKFHGTSKKGSLIVQRLVNLRVAFSVPNRLFLMKNPQTKVSDEEVKSAKDFLNAFMTRNGLDTSVPKDLAKEGELEGQILVEYVWDSKAKVPELKYYPYSSVGYVVKRTGAHKYRINDPEKTMSVITGMDKIDLKNDQFSFIAFNDTLLGDDGYPTCGPILREIEFISEDMWDWRKLNHLFAHPTPHFKCENVETANAVQDMIRKQGWRLGNALATNATFTLVGPTGQEAIMLMNSITTLAKLISGHTGIGIHFLGFANVMSNRATADSMGEPTEVVLHSEISSWRAFYFDMFKKAIRMRNKKLNNKMVEDAVVPVLVPLTDRQWRVVKDIYMPLAEKGLISRDTLWSRIPDVDPDQELEKVLEQEAKAEEKKKALGLKPEGEEEKPDEDENNEEDENEEDE